MNLNYLFHLIIKKFKAFIFSQLDKKDFNYLFHLTINKIKTPLYVKLEKRVESDAVKDLDTFTLLLIKQIFDTLIISNNGNIYLKQKLIIKENLLF